MLPQHETLPISNESHYNALMGKQRDTAPKWLGYNLTKKVKQPLEGVSRLW